MRTSSAEAHHIVGWLALPVLAVLNGLIRDTTYGRSMSYDLSHAISVVPLLIAILAWSAVLASRRPLPSVAAALRVGLAWLALTLAFEFGLGGLQGLSMDAMLAAYDITSGKLWPLIPLATLLAPALMRWIAQDSRPLHRIPRRTGG
jgi:hypothetical protein